MPRRTPSRIVLIASILLNAMPDICPLPAQEPARRAAEITPAFEPENRPAGLEEEVPTWVGCLAFSPDGKALAVGDRPTRPLCTFGGSAPPNENGGLIRIIDLGSNRIIQTIRPDKRPRHEYEVVALAYTPDGRALVVLGKESRPDEDAGRVYGYDVATLDASTGRVLRRIDSTGLDDWWNPTFSRDASTFAALTHAGIRVWDLSNGRQLPAPTGAPEHRDAVPALSPDGKTLAAGDERGEVGLWETATGRRLARFPVHRKDGHTFKSKALTFSADGRMLASIGQYSVQVDPPYWQYTSELRLIDVAARADRAVFPAAPKHVFQEAAFSKDGKAIAAVTREVSDEIPSRGRLRIWDAASGRERVSIPHRARPCTHLTYAGDGSLLVEADRERIVLRNADDGHGRGELDQGGFTSDDETIALSPDGRFLAASNGRFRLWDLRAAPESR